VPDVEGVHFAAGKNVDCERRLEFYKSAQWCVRFFPPGWKPGSTAGKDARRYRRAETTPRLAHRVEGEAADDCARAEGVIRLVVRNILDDAGSA